MPNDNEPYLNLIAESLESEEIDDDEENEEDEFNSYYDNDDYAEDESENSTVGDSNVYFRRSSKKPVFYSSNKKQFSINKCKRFISNEIEISDLRYHSSNQLNLMLTEWNCGVVSDGSICSPEDAGCEITTSPANGNLYLDQLDDITDALKKHRAKTNSSCGMHTHIDTRDLCPLDIRKVVILYYILEPAIYSCIPPSRRSNEYAIPCGWYYYNCVANPNKLKSKLYMSLYNTFKPGTLKREKYMQARYYALNLHSWCFRGTIEFRHAPGTIDFEKITNWSLACANLINVALTMNEEKLNNLVKSTTSLAAKQKLLLSIQPNDKIANWLESRILKFKNTPIEFDEEGKAIARLSYNQTCILDRIKSELV